MALNEFDIARIIAHEGATGERIRMVVRVERKRRDRDKTLRIRKARQAKYWIQGRV